MASKEGGELVVEELAEVGVLSLAEELSLNARSARAGGKRCPDEAHHPVVLKVESTNGSKLELEKVTLAVGGT